MFNTDNLRAAGEASESGAYSDLYALPPSQYFPSVSKDVHIEILKTLSAPDFVNYCWTARNRCPRALIEERRRRDFGDRRRFGDPLVDYTKLVRKIGTTRYLNEVDPRTITLTEMPNPRVANYKIKFRGNMPEEGVYYIGIQERGRQRFGEAFEDSLEDAVRYFNRTLKYLIADYLDQDYVIQSITDDEGRTLPDIRDYSAAQFQDGINVIFDNNVEPVAVRLKLYELFAFK